VVRKQNEGSFGCEVVARALGQPNVPECAVGFHLFCLYAEKKSSIILSSISFCLFTMNANGLGYGQWRFACDFPVKPRECSGGLLTYELSIHPPLTIAIVSGSCFRIYI
jgi:hypothetical protein